VSNIFFKIWFFNLLESPNQKLIDDPTKLKIVKIEKLIKNKNNSKGSKDRKNSFSRKNNCNPASITVEEKSDKKFINSIEETDNNLSKNKPSFTNTSAYDSDTSVKKIQKLRKKIIINLISDPQIIIDNTNNKKNTIEKEKENSATKNNTNRICNNIDLSFSEQITKNITNNNSKNPNKIKQNAIRNNCPKLTVNLNVNNDNSKISTSNVNNKTDISSHNSSNSANKNLTISKIPIKNSQKISNNLSSNNIQKVNINISKINNANKTVNSLYKANHAKDQNNYNANYSNLVLSSSTISVNNNKDISKNGEFNKIINKININNNHLNYNNSAEQNENKTSNLETKEKYKKLANTRMGRNVKVNNENYHSKIQTFSQNIMQINSSNSTIMNQSGKNSIIIPNMIKKENYIETKILNINLNDYPDENNNNTINNCNQNIINSTSVQNNNSNNVNKISNSSNLNLKRNFKKQMLLNFNKALKNHEFKNNVFSNHQNNTNIINSSTNNINNSHSNVNSYIPSYNSNANIISGLTRLATDIACKDLDKSTQNKICEKIERSNSENKTLGKIGNSLLNYIPIVKTNLYNPERENNFLEFKYKRGYSGISPANNLREARKRKYSANTNNTDESFDSNASSNNIIYGNIDSSTGKKFENIFRKLEEIDKSKNKYKRVDNSINEGRSQTPNISNEDYLSHNLNFKSEKILNKKILSPVSVKGEENISNNNLYDNDYFQTYSDLTPINENGINRNLEEVENININIKDQSTVIVK